MERRQWLPATSPLPLPFITAVCFSATLACLHGPRGNSGEGREGGREGGRKGGREGGREGGRRKSYKMKTNKGLDDLLFVVSCHVTITPVPITVPETGAHCQLYMPFKKPSLFVSVREIPAYQEDQLTTTDSAITLLKTKYWVVVLYKLF